MVTMLNYPQEGRLELNLKHIEQNRFLRMQNTNRNVLTTVALGQSFIAMVVGRPLLVNCMLNRGAENCKIGKKIYRTRYILSDNLVFGNTQNRTVSWLDSTVSNSLMVGQCCVQQFNCWSVLCPTVQWMVSVVSYCPMVVQCWVIPSKGWTVLCPTVQWLDGAGYLTDPV